MEEEGGEGEERKEDEEERKEEEYDIPKNAFIDLGGEGKYTPMPEEQKKLLGKKSKRKTKLKEIQIELFGKKVKGKIEPSKLQKVFNIVSKSNDFSLPGVKASAAKLNYQIDDSSASLLVDLGKAKVSVKKLGIPGSLCKQKLHFYVFLKLFDSMNIITDDRIVWNCYYGVQTSLDKPDPKFKTADNLLSNSKIKAFSIVSNKLFTNEKLLSGYCQDENKNICIINDGNKIDPDKIAKSFQDGTNCNRILDAVFPNGQKYNFYTTPNVMLAIPSTYNLRESVNLINGVKCINTKNNLSDGLKQLKVNNQVGSYLNLHEVKLTDFSPSCLFVTSFKDYKTFIDAEFDYNTIYNNFKFNNHKTIRTFNLPTDCVFWDNIHSFIELLGLVKMTQDLNKDLDADIIATIEEFNKYKFAFSAWKSVYKSFEGIVLHFYDSITNKLTIDGVTKLKDKVDNFLTNYSILKAHVSYPYVGDVIGKIQSFCPMMRNFFSGTAASDACTAIRKTISVLMTGNDASLKKDGMDIEKVFRTTGIMCLECLYDGYWSMIPKVRARVSFLGDVSGDVINNENLRNNIRNLSRLFEEKKDEEKRGGDDPGNFLNQKEKYESYMRAGLDKTFNSYKDKKNLQTFKEELINRMFNEKAIYKSMMEDITTLLYDPDIEEKDILAYADFTENPDVIGYLDKFNEGANVVAAISAKNNPTKVLDAITVVKRNPKKKISFKNSMGRAKGAAPPPLRTKGNTIKLDTGILKEAIITLKPEVAELKDKAESQFNNKVLEINA